MEKKPFRAVVWYVQRFGPSIFIPTVCIGLVIADYTHTQKWKREKLEKERLEKEGEEPASK